jgi:hypothetical protein
MEIIVKPHAEYQTHSLIEFLLGDHGREGWLEKYSDQTCSPMMGYLACTAREDRVVASWR